jgi:hypothetical protein
LKNKTLKENQILNINNNNANILANKPKTITLTTLKTTPTTTTTTSMNSSTPTNGLITLKTIPIANLQKQNQSSLKRPFVMMAVFFIFGLNILQFM